MFGKKFERRRPVGLVRGWRREVQRQEDMVDGELRVFNGALDVGIGLRRSVWCRSLWRCCVDLIAVAKNTLVSLVAQCQNHGLLFGFLVVLQLEHIYS